MTKAVGQPKALSTTLLVVTRQSVGVLVKGIGFGQTSIYAAVVPRPEPTKPPNG